MKKRQNKDYSGIIYSLIFIIVMVGLCVLMFLPTNKTSTQTQNNQVENRTVKQQTPPTLVQPTTGENIPNFEQFQYRFSYDINVQGTVTDLFFRIPVPMGESEKQYILNNKITIKPTKTYYDGATMFAEFNFPELKSQKLTIAHEGTTNVRTYDLKTAKLINKNPHIENNLNRYLVEEDKIEINDPIVKSYASKIKGETREEIVQNIYEFTQKHMTYKHLQGVSGAKKALKDRVGECSEFSAIMIALCRAKGIPARVVIGHIAREQNTKHNWVEVYFDEYGWVTFDPTAQPVTVNVYQNGKLVRQEQRLNTSKIPVKYIATGKNLFSPYWIKYYLPHNVNGKATVKETINIKKISK